MPRVAFTSHLERLLDCPPVEIEGATVRAALEAVFTDNPRLRSYILDEHARLRAHVAVFVDGRPLADRQRLADPVKPSAEIWVLQALSGG